MNLTISEKLRMILKRKGLKVSDIAGRLGCTVQNLYKKFDRNSWTDESLKEVCDAIGIVCEISFIDSETGEKY